jgi:hypothetical protein
MRKILISVAALLISLNQQVLPQTQEDQLSRNTIFLELGGQGFFYTLNYDYRFSRHFCGRVGFTSFTLENFLIFDDLNITAFPIMAEYLVGGGNHFLELGAGVIAVRASTGFHFVSKSSAWGPVFSANVAYRYQPADGGLFFRASMPAFLNTDGAGGVWWGVSLGYTF